MYLGKAKLVPLEGALELAGLASFVGLAQAMKRRMSLLSHLAAGRCRRPTRRQRNPSGGSLHLRPQKFVEGIEWDLRD